MIRDSRIQCYIKKIGIHHYPACKAKVVISFQVACLPDAESFKVAVSKLQHPRP